MKPSDEWQTPKALFKELDELYGPFFWDACCNEENCLVTEQISILRESKPYDYLLWKHMELFHRMNIFMNPPYSNPEPFIKKAWEDAKYFRVVILVPVSILSNKYMDFLDGMGSDVFANKIVTREWRNGIEIVHLSRRVKFEHPTKKTSSPPFACCLIIMDKR